MDLNTLVEEVDSQERTIITVAACSNFIAAEAAFEAMRKLQPKTRYMLRQGARVIRRSYD